MAGLFQTIAARFAILFTARLTSALLMTVALAFGSHAVFAPNRLPMAGGLNLIDLGLVNPQEILPVEVSASDLAELRAQAGEARATAKPYFTQWVEANPASVRWLNIGVATLAAALLFASIFLRMRGRGLRLSLVQRGAITITT